MHGVAAGDRGAAPSLGRRSTRVSTASRQAKAIVGEMRGTTTKPSSQLLALAMDRRRRDGVQLLTRLSDTSTASESSHATSSTAPLDVSGTVCENVGCSA